VEISSPYPYCVPRLALELEDQAGTSRRASGKPEAHDLGAAPAADAVDLVQAQNLLSPPSEAVDLTRAAELLSQVRDRMSLMDRQEVRELYQFDRLRDLLCRVSQGEVI